MPTTPICLTIVLLLDLLLEALPTRIIKYVVFLDSVLLLSLHRVESEINAFTYLQ